MLYTTGLLHAALYIGYYWISWTPSQISKRVRMHVLLKKSFRRQTRNKKRKILLIKLYSFRALCIVVKVRVRPLITSNKKSHKTPCCSSNLTLKPVCVSELWKVIKGSELKGISLFIVWFKRLVGNT